MVGRSPPSRPPPGCVNPRALSGLGNLLGRGDNEWNYGLRCFRRNDFPHPPRIRIALWVKAHPDWLGIFDDANLIYGLETLALTATIADPDLPPDNSLVTCYVDNNNTLCALVRSDSGTLIISALSRIFWAICAIRGIVPWLERVDSDLNISDLPTRNEELPINCDSTRQFPIGEILLRMAFEGFTSQLNGFFDPEELVGRLYTPYVHLRKNHH